MPNIVPFERVEDMHSVAADFSQAFTRQDNEDIAIDFPGTARRYSGETERIYAELLETQAQCQQGIREQFVVYYGATAVGLSAIQLVDEPPMGIEPTVPNLSGLIFNPWRGIGLGSMSLKYRVGVIDERFGGKAYSLVRKDNLVSQRLVESGGLTVAGDDEAGRLIYLYNSDQKIITVDHLPSSPPTS